MKKFLLLFAGMLLAFSAMAQTEESPVTLDYGNDDYIVSYTNTFFDSGYVPTEKTMIVTKMRPMSDAGARKTNSYTEDGFFGVVNSGSEVSWKRNNGNHDFLEIFQDVKYSGKEGSAANGATYTFVLKQGEFKTYIEKDGEMELYQTKTWTPTAFQKGEATMYIGAVNDASNSKTWRSNALIYFFDIYEDGVLVKHFVPDFNNGEYCLYEYESGSYAMNIGSGDIVACTGEHHYADVTVYGVTQKMCLICGEKVPIAQITIGETTTKYYDAQSFCLAFEDIEGTATVKLLSDLMLDIYLLYNETYEEKVADITLDLNGHSIKRSNDYVSFESYGTPFTIEGEGTIECIHGDGVIFGGYGSFVINGGTYIAASCICGLIKKDGYVLTINGGKFKAPYLYPEGELSAKPIVKGGLFSMDPSDCVADGYETVANDDEETKDEYPYKVVEKSLTPTAIDAVDAEKSGKVIKTIENGRVVIIRDGEKFDLAGRKL